MRKVVIAIYLLVIVLNVKALTSSDSISRVGAFQNDGSYLWHYKIDLPSFEKTTKSLVAEYLIDSNFPFAIKNFPKSLNINSSGKFTLNFDVLVPASFIQEPVNVKKFNLTVKYGIEKTAVRTRIIEVRGPLPQHPRLLVRKSEAEALKNRMFNVDFDAIRKDYNQQKGFVTSGISTNGMPSEPIRQKMEALALEYMTNSKANENSGKEAITLSIKYLSSITKAENYWGIIYAFDAVFGAALVYDWCYGLLKSEEKVQLIAEMKRVCCLAEYCVPSKTKKQYLTGHYGEHGPSVFLAMGIATFDEDPELFDFEYDEQINSFAPSRNPLYKAGMHHQGSQYLHGRYSNEVLQAFILEKLGLNPYLPEISSLAYHGIYTTIPQEKDMDGMPGGDGHNNISMGCYQFYYLAANLSKDPFLQIFSKQFLSKTAEQSARLFLYHNPSIPSETLANLKLSRFFPSPEGVMISRTNWDKTSRQTDYSSKTMVVYMNMEEYNAQNHNQLDIGHFGIYYKGHLAIDAGIYQGSENENRYAGSFFRNYYIRTVAHNSLLILDPNEPKPFVPREIAEARDGGQFYPRKTDCNTSQELFANGKSAQVLASDIADGVSPDYSYLKGDMTTAYLVPKYLAIYPSKVDSVRRSFVFLDFKSAKIPGALIVLDKIVSADASFKKKWLLHSQNEPIVNQNIITAQSTQGGRNGKIQTTVLLPEMNNQEIEKIGGAGKEYWADGKNWGSVTQEDAGKWRIELSPKLAAKSDNFLNVIQAMDANPSPTPFLVKKVMAEKGHYVAVEINDRIVAQQLSLNEDDKEISFSLGDKNSEYKVLITDLKVGEWKIISPSGEKRISVKKSSGTAYFTSKGGQFNLLLM